MIEPNYLPFILIGGGIIFVILFFHYVPFFLWLSAKVSGVRISLIQLFLMRIRNVPPYVIVPAMIEAHKAGLSTITRDELEAHYMAGGHVEKVVHALVSASKANIELSFLICQHLNCIFLTNFLRISQNLLRYYPVFFGIVMLVAIIHSISGCFPPFFDPFFNPDT